MEPLLPREEFRNAVFTRDWHRCVFCLAPAVDAHHILERRLFSDGGYYLSNGASVCAKHHLECEQTTISVREIRCRCGITNPTIPPHFYRDVDYDKWGNIILDNGQRMRGELFEDESVQKVLTAGHRLTLFTNRVKYPRTYHVPFSPGVGQDDRVLETLVHFKGQRVVVTEKLDGENTSMYSDGIHARSIDSRSHPSRAWVKAFHASICGNIPPGWRVCGENMWATHSIAYDDLETFFYVFSLWDEKNVCLSWDETLEWCDLLGLHHVPILYAGPFDFDALKGLYSEELTRRRESEGWVLRAAESFHYGQFRHQVAKYVRAGHNRTHGFWTAKVVPNKLLAQ